MPLTANGATSADVVIVGAGVAGLVAACEVTRAGKRVIIVEQEPAQSLGGQAFWSFGGLFLVDSPEQRRMGIHDSYDLALQDWMSTAAFDRPEDAWPRKWAEAYLAFAAGAKRSWLHSLGMRWFPVVGWAERGGYGALGHGNSVPRFHVTWGTGPGLLAPFVERVRAAVARGQQSSRTAVGSFELHAPAVLVTSGGIGGNHELVRRNWPERLGQPPAHMISGVPHHVDGRMIQITQDAGGHVIHPDRMWHYVEGIENWNPIWTLHGIRILPGPSPLWLDATGKRL
ncbi:MAG TPA: FAD-dependent oxidoreductase, partial [Ktedonobacterales bacterium]|nr:FAD-dependent oxidoreductase [Ktedonobacterales bacterium]